MARMNGVPEDRADLVSRLFFRAVRKRTGKVAESWKIASHAPGILRGWAAMEWFLDRANRVEAKLKRLAQLKVALMVGCPT
ncbi:MAG: hypothetical protein O7A09_11580 [Proteobacteria bacterium]|nr:hypothetical protein [Pseudomonadota bacterium]MCZ6783897.1 hypothetical protein [Pseudomonadota bacterium]